MKEDPKALLQQFERKKEKGSGSESETKKEVTSIPVKAYSKIFSTIFNEPKNSRPT